VNERLYHLNDEKNRIIGVAAHDLRNPLSGILLGCDDLDESPRAA
jgi:signal transduction histidine kinase